MLVQSFYEKPNQSELSESYMMHVRIHPKIFSQNEPLSSKHKNSGDRVASNFRSRVAYLTPGRNYLDAMDGIHKGDLVRVRPDFESGLVPNYREKTIGIMMGF